MLPVVPPPSPSLLALGKPAGRMPDRFPVWTPCLLGLVGLLLAGCSKPVVLEGNAGDARQTLTTVLDAWKQGEGTSNFAKRTPPWVVADEDWDSGVKLLEYEIGEPIAFGGHWRVPAKIRLNSEKRGDHQRQVAYAVTLQPAVSVIRADDVID